MFTESSGLGVRKLSNKELRPSLHLWKGKMTKKKKKKTKQQTPKGINANCQRLYKKFMLILPEIFAGKTEEHSYLPDRFIATLVNRCESIKCANIKPCQ